MPTAHLTADLTWDYTDWRGRDCSVDLEIPYTCDADGDVRVLCGQGELPTAEWVRVGDHIEAEIAPQAYAEWLADADMGTAA